MIDIPSVGIARVNITDKPNGAGAWRFEKSHRLQPAANRLYRAVFERIGIPLLPGLHQIDCSVQSFNAGYDRQLGIDVFLRFEHGGRASLQEKFLFTAFKTVTVEYYQNWRTQEPGDWFNMNAQYYFVGYDRNETNDFQDWILLDWPAVQRVTAQEKIKWLFQPNREDGARANFTYAPFAAFPPECVVACSAVLVPSPQSKLETQLSLL